MLKRKRYLLTAVTILVLLIAFLVLRQSIVPKFKILPLSTSAAYDPGALVISEEDAERILNRLGLSTNDIVIKGKKVIYLVPLVCIGYYVNGTFYSKEEISEILSRYRINSTESYSNIGIYMVLKPNWNSLFIFIGTEDMATKPLRSNPPSIILEPENNVTYDNSRRVIYPSTVYGLSGAIARIAIYIENGEPKDLKSQRHELEEEIRDYLKDQMEEIKKYGNLSIFKWNGPRIPGKLIYINNWPVYFRPMHDVCDDHFTHRICFTMFSVASTTYRNVRVVIQCLTNDDDTLNQMNIILNKLMGEEIWRTETIYS